MRIIYREFYTRGSSNFLKTWAHFEIPKPIKSMVACVHRRRQQFIVFSNAEQYYILRSVLPSWGVNVHVKKSEMRCSILEFRGIFHHVWRCVILGFRHEVEEICALPGHSAAWSGNFLRTFQDNLSALSSRVKNPRRVSWPLKMGPIRCTETSVRNYHYTLRYVVEERRSHSWRWSYRPKHVTS